MRYLLSSLLLLTCLVARSQQTDAQLSRLILERDSAFWKAYNDCNTAGMEAYLWEDVEFFHDKGGPSTGAKDIAAAFQRNVCSQRDQFRLRREAVAGTVKVYPLRKNDTLYGAVISGDHLFYVQPAGGAEKAEGLAKFNHLWLLRNGEWKMERILSYDHGPAPYISAHKAIVLPQATLRKYAGVYDGPQSKGLAFHPNGEGLEMEVRGKRFQLYPYSDSQFFSRERDLSFEFKGGKLFVLEGGKVVEELAPAAGAK
ncbi:nuclear transport factor 2 family protein [Chitinophaga lutea]